MYYVKESLRHGGVVDALGAGCVLTGGGAMLPGMLDVTESQLRVPARTGLPVRLSHMPSELDHPACAVAIGMLLYAHRTRTTRAAEDNNTVCAPGCAPCSQQVFKTGTRDQGIRESTKRRRRTKATDRDAAGRYEQIEESESPNGTAS